MEQQAHPSTTASLIFVLLVIALSLTASCASSRADAELNQRGYLDPPNRVWATIQLSLETLGYETEESDRAEGTIRAVSPADDDGPAVVLEIDQFKRTDIVRVHVTATGNDEGAQLDTARQDAAVAEFLALLDAKLRGTPLPIE